MYNNFENQGTQNQKYNQTQNNNNGRYEISRDFESWLRVIILNKFSLPCCVNCTTAAGSFVETATGVAPTAGIFISASGGNALPLASTKLLVVDNAPVVVVVVDPLLLGLDDAVAAADVVLLPDFAGNRDCVFC